jgi:tripartite-type tricarboxylate transporter receptor subunit TctC
MGFPEMTSDSWQGFFVGARTPAPVVARLNAAVRKVLADPRVVDRFKIGAATVIDTETAEKCTAFVKQQTAFWSKLVRQVGMEGSL